MRPIHKKKKRRNQKRERKVWFGEAEEKKGFRLEHNSLDLDGLARSLAMATRILGLARLDGQLGYT